mmetsp:Transcript_32654/g.39673  ORF Transcript_32654/g.39673 Transcript_32654/m.39673 type:complete len:1372 (-) Transcript_32654:215-4330(-)
MSTVINVFWSNAGLLSGSLSQCLDPSNITDATCEGGLTSVAAVIRISRARGDGPALFFPVIERTTRFVQMHPLGWGVNRLIMRSQFGWDTFLAPPSLFSGVRDMSSLQSHDFTPLLSNLDLGPTNAWLKFIEQVHFDHDTGIAAIVVGQQDQPGSVPQVESVNAMLDYVALLNKDNGCFSSDDMDGQYTNFPTQNSTDVRLSRCWSPIAFFTEADSKKYKAFLRAVQAHLNPPVLLINDGNHKGAPSVPTKVAPNLWVIGLEGFRNKTVCEQLRIEFDKADTLKMRTVSNVTLIQHKIKGLSLELKDKTYVSDQIFLRKQADTALENDPVVGSSGFMPFARTDDEMKYRKCMGGECPIGNLFTSALRWTTDADIAFLSSGGLRGPGWPEGPVRVGNIWEALPFANFLCTGVMSGVSVFRLLNYTTAVSTFESTYTTMGDRLLQMSGMKISYNTLVDGSGSGRLMSVDVWDKDTQVYLPLERLKLYKFVTDRWLCTRFDPYPSLLGGELIIDGEVPGAVDSSQTVQDIVGEYLSSLNKPYNTTIQGKYVNNTYASKPLAFLQSPESCLADYFWKAKTLTCVPCPGGKNIKFSEELISLYISPDKSSVNGRNILNNRELFNVTIAPKSNPSWVISKQLATGSTMLRPGDSIGIDFDIDPGALVEGNTRGSIFFGVVLDGDYQGCLTGRDITFDVLVQVAPDEDLNQIVKIRPVGLTIMVLAAGLAVAFSVWTFVFRKHQVVKSSQQLFLQLICFGTFIMATAIIPLSIDDSIASQRGCDIACMVTPWLISTGFVVTFSALFAKTWCINRVIRGAKTFDPKSSMAKIRAISSVTVKKRDVLAPFIVAFSVNCVLLLCWTLIDPSCWIRQPANEANLSDLSDISNTFGSCQSKGTASMVLAGLTVSVDFLMLTIVCVQAYNARHMNGGNTEIHWVLVACASWIQVIVVGIPVMLLTQRQTSTSYFTKTALIFLACVSMLLLMFVPKICAIRKSTKVKAPSVRMLLSGRTPPLEMPEKCNFHIFMSHAWGTGQGTTHAITRKMQQFFPGLRVWLDVDELQDTSKLEEYVSASAVFVLFYSAGYFQSRNCRREIYTAMKLNKPTILLYVGDENVLNEMKEECIEHCVCSESPGSEQILNELFGCNDGSSDTEFGPIQWLNEGSFSAAALNRIYCRVLAYLPNYQKNYHILEKEGIIVPGELSAVSLHSPVTLLVSEEFNVGVSDVASEITRMLSLDGGNSNMITITDAAWCLEGKGKLDIYQFEDISTKEQDDLSESQKFFLLYLKKDTFAEKQLIPILKACTKDPNISILLVHENEFAKGGCDFDSVYSTAPQDLIDPPCNLFRNIATPLYKIYQYREVSLRKILCKMGATHPKDN